MKNKPSTSAQTDVTNADVPATETADKPSDTAPQPTSADTATTEPPATSAPEMLTMTADDLSQLLSQAEERGYRRASTAADTDPVQPGIYEEPDAIGQQPAGWKASPLLSSRRPSIWDR